MPRRKRSFGWVKWLVFLVLIAGIVLAGILIKNSFDNNNDSNQWSMDTNNEEGEKIDEKPEGASGDDMGDYGQEKKVPQYDGESPNESEVLTGSVAYVNVINGKLAVRVNIDQFLQSGKCYLELSKDGRVVYSQSAEIIESVTTSTCDGFDIPVNNSMNGEFQIKIDLESQGKFGKIEGGASI